MPGAVPLPSAEQVVAPTPRPVLDGQVPPRNTGPDPEPYAVDQLPPRPDGRPSRLRALRQQRLQRRPLLIREISPPHEPRSFIAQDPLSIHGLDDGLDGDLVGAVPEDFRVELRDGIDATTVGPVVTLLVDDDSVAFLPDPGQPDAVGQRTRGRREEPFAQKAATVVGVDDAVVVRVRAGRDQRCAMSWGSHARYVGRPCMRKGVLLRHKVRPSPITALIVNAPAGGNSAALADVAVLSVLPRRATAVAAGAKERSLNAGVAAVRPGERRRVIARCMVWLPCLWTKVRTCPVCCGHEGTRSQGRNAWCLRRSAITHTAGTRW